MDDPRCHGPWRAEASVQSFSGALSWLVGMKEWRWRGSDQWKGEWDHTALTVKAGKTYGFC